MGKGGASARSARWTVWALFCGVALLLPATVLALGLAGFRVNITPSKPLGLWRIRALDRPVRIGDLVFICPSENSVIREAWSRGYLRRGLCPGGIAPLIKTVAATAGQVIEITSIVTIDGRVLSHSGVALKDGQGRNIVPHGGGAIPDGTVYLHSEFPGSFDSRYFGPLPVDNILGLAQEVFTYAR
ncbi:conjugative transfer signal peptidase TraF [Agrobacterium rhizogenes]|uniref:conjugative transfer signal peptidase TraF n=1 Tax=Rhizobium rhizogenes TaxID=359 RepID=UPI0022B5F965|nr:conjugative transfer signal peptidase TraF [Rhizobium rhizogenes]MCZ7450261.1 conjugative transfer signal peptidase TraF [Rhizobium rhizogenes]